jgi:hypothetical protein
MRQNNASDDEIAIRIKQLLNTLNNKADPAETAKTIILEHTKEKIPETVTFPKEGQLMMDGFGNLVIILLDGTIKPYVKSKPTEKPKEEK